MSKKRDAPGKRLSVTVYFTEIEYMRIFKNLPVYTKKSTYLKSLLLNKKGEKTP